MQPVAILCRNVANEWIGSLENCHQPARVFFPYITKLAEEALRSQQSKNVAVYTRFDLQAFAAGASSLETLRSLAGANFRLFDLPRLHAKIFENPQAGFATVGSQNLTIGGTKNREATVVIREPKLLAALTKQLNRWTAQAQPITLEMISEAEPIIAELRRDYRSLGRKCRGREKEIFAAQARRDEEAHKVTTQQSAKTDSDAVRVIRLNPPVLVKDLAAAMRLKTFQINKDLIQMNVFANQATILEPAQVAELCKKHGFVFETRFREELERHQQAWLDRVSIELNSYQQQRSDKFSKLLGEDGEVPWKICRDVCWNAMEWEIKGRIRPSRRDADHLKKGPYGWEINLGGKSANRFGIALAIKRCREKLAEMFPESQSRWEILTASEKANLEVWVRKSIIRHDDKLYGLSYQGRKDGRIPLGNHLVNPPSVVEALLHFSGFNSWQKPSPLAVAI